MRVVITGESAAKELALGRLDGAGKALITFLEPKTRDLLKEEIPEASLADQWKEILIQAIHFLRINDCRERAFLEDAFGPWTMANKTRMNDGGEGDRKQIEAAKLNTYGIEELYGYFSEFRAFESALYGTDSNYRDHVVHPLYVWLLGLKVLSEFAGDFKCRCADALSVVEDAECADPKWSCFSQYRLNNGEGEACIADPEQASDKNPNILQVSAGELGAIWTVIALTHDLGYPLEKVDRINERLERMLGKFGQIGFSKSTFQFTLQHDPLVQHLLRIVSSCLDPITKGEWRTRRRSKYQAKFARSWESLDHGIVSSLILLRSLTFFLETDTTLDQDKALKDEDARQFAIRSEILHAIAAHSVEKVYHLSAFTLPFLLVLSDDLQEWGRPTMMDLRVGDLSGRAERVELSIEKKANNQVEISCEIKYQEQGVSHDLQRRHALRVFKTWHERLRPALDDRTRNMSFRWSITFGSSSVPWCLQINTAASLWDIVVATGPKKDNEQESTGLPLYESK